MHHYVYVDSTNRDPSTYGNSYTLSLTTPLRDITRVDLVSAKIPNSMYNITSGDNVITISGTSYSIAPGFYSAQGLAEALQNSTGYSIDYLCNEGRFIMWSKNPFTVVINTDEMLRATGELQGSSTLAGATRNPYMGQQILVSPSLIDLSTNEYVFLDIAELRTTKIIDTKVFSGNTFSGSTVSATFGMIPLDVVSGQIKTFKEDTDYKIRVSYETPLGSISKLTIRWLDKNGNLLNFNGFDNNSFVLRVSTKDHEVPKEAPVPKEIIKYVPLPAVEKKGSRIWILYLIILGILGGFGWYLFVRQ